MSYPHPIVTAIVVAVVIAAFCLMAIGMLRCVRFLRAYRSELRQRAADLRIHRMLGRLGVSVDRYLGRTHPGDVERQLANCAHCPEPNQCDDYLDRGGRVDPHDFCPNIRELEKLAPPGSQSAPMASRKSRESAALEGRLETGA